MSLSANGSTTMLAPNHILIDMSTIALRISLFRRKIHLKKTMLRAEGISVLIE